MSLFNERLLIKETCQFSDFFSEYKPYIVNSKEFKPIPFGEKATIGNWLQVSKAQTAYNWSFNIKPTNKLIEIAKQSMLSIDYDQIYFRLMLYSNGTAMLIAQYNQIIGSRWIAMIDINSIPEVV